MSSTTLLSGSYSFRYKLIRGKLDLNAVVGRMKARSRYGGKYISLVHDGAFSLKPTSLQPRSQRHSKYTTLTERPPICLYDHTFCKVPKYSLPVDTCENRAVPQWLYPSMLSLIPLRRNTSNRLVSEYEYTLRCESLLLKMRCPSNIIDVHENNARDPECRVGWSSHPYGEPAL